MKTRPTPRSASRTKVPVPALHNGDRLTQKEFHRRYEEYPDHIKFELIGGVVYMASQLGIPHGSYQPQLSGVFWLYAGRTPGTQLLDNTTTILGEESEPQPDLSLRVLPEYGGRSRNTKDNYVRGASELLSEIAHSTISIDLHRKRDDYERAGVQEYLVLCVREQLLRWFDFAAKDEIKPDRAGIARSRVFPGLWIDVPALLAGDYNGLFNSVQAGLASPEHAAFVERLARQARQKDRKRRKGV